MWSNSNRHWTNRRLAAARAMVGLAVSQGRRRDGISKTRPQTPQFAIYRCSGLFAVLELDGVVSSAHEELRPKTIHTTELSVDFVCTVVEPASGVASAFLKWPAFTVTGSIGVVSVSSAAETVAVATSSCCGRSAVKSLSRDRLGVGASLNARLRNCQSADVMLA